MIIQDSASLSTALDRRMQVARIAMLERAPAVGDSDDAPGASVSDELAGGLAYDRANAAPGSLGARLPLGRIVVARVVDVPHPELLVAEVDDLRVELAWPPGGGTVPRTGQDIALRVLAHEPMLVLQNVPDDELASAHDAPPAPSAQGRLSSAALQLQRSAAPNVAASYRALADLPIDAPQGGDVARAAAASPGEPRAAGPMRFDVPILQVTPVADASPDTVAARGAAAAVPDAPSQRHADLPVSNTTATEAVDALAPHRAVDAPATPSDATNGVRDADGTPTAPSARAPDDASPTAPFAPLVLQGPAWVGQPIELVVRRERADEALDNPVLDHWCGEVVIDLPRLGRVAGHLSFSMQGLRVRIEADDDASVAALSAATAELATAFADVDLRVSGLAVAQPAPDATRPTALAARAAGRAYGAGSDG